MNEEQGTPNQAHSQLPVTVYSPDTGLKDPRELFGGIWRDMFAHQSRELAWRLTTRTLSGQFRQSLLGYFWLFFPPLLNSLIFIFLQRSRILRMEETVVPYAVLSIRNRFSGGAGTRPPACACPHADRLEPV